MRRCSPGPSCFRLILAPTLATACFLLGASPPLSAQPRATIRRAPATTSTVGDLQGRLLLLVATQASPEPRFQLSSGYGSAQVFGLDVTGWRAGESRAIDDQAFGYPVRRLSQLPPGEYWVQALLHRYETVTPAHGKTIQVPWDRGEGQQWNRAPGNLYSKPAKMRWDPRPGRAPEWRLELDQVIPPIEEPKDTPWIRHVRMRSKLLSDFWGRDVFLGAHVLLPFGFAEHPQARYPLMIFHGHFPADFGGFRDTPPDPDLPCEPSPRFALDCYNRIQEEEAYAFYQRWISAGFPRFLAVEIQHANPFYDDSYAVNSANLGPYGDAITYEFVPFLEQTFRGLGSGWARFLYGGSTGGWEALAAQVFYPKEYNGAFAACPDPIDFRATMLVNLYEDENAYRRQGPFQSLPLPSHRDWLGQVSATMESENHLELALGDKTRSGGQWDIWEAVYSPLGADGYPQRIFDKTTGAIDPAVAAHWRENYDLRHILERDWARLAPDLAGKIHLYVGDMDNYYLNNAVYRMEEFLKRADPPYRGEVAYGDRFEHCWNGDPATPNHLTRLRYHTMYLDKILRRIATTAPAGADLSSWRY